MNNLNVFKNSFYSLRRPLWSIKRIFKSFKWAYQRITKGFCDKDLYDLSEFYLNLLHQSIFEFKNNTLSHPHNMTEKDWEIVLYKISNFFYQANMENFENYPSKSYTNNAKDKGFDLLKEHFFDLWS